MSTVQLDAPDPLGDLVAEQLAPVVAGVLGDERAWPTSWEARPLGPPLVNPATTGVYSVHGSARTGTGDDVRWRVVLKTVADTWFDDPALDVGYMHDEPDWNYWKRELLVFGSGFLDRFRGPFVPVRCWAVEETGPDHGRLWLEHLGDGGAGRARWPVEVLAAAAHDLGVFNGQGLEHAADLHRLSWAARRWLRGWVGLMDRWGVGRAAEDKDCWSHPLVRDVLPTSAMRRFSALWGESHGILAALESLPTTVSHHDAQWSNLFDTDRGASPRRTTAIDLSFLGLAPVGQDLGHHVACNLYNHAVDVDEAGRHDQASTVAYLSGLRETGWDGDESSVRFARAAAASLQIGTFLVADLVELSENVGADPDPGEQSWPERMAEREGLSVNDVMARWARCVDYLLCLGEEARDLGARMT